MLTSDSSYRHAIVVTWCFVQLHVGLHPSVDALTPLTANQLALRASPTLHSVGEITTHIISAHARWFYTLMGEGGEAFAALTMWDRPGMPLHNAAELVQGLEITWQAMYDAMTRWNLTDWQQTYSGAQFGVPAMITRQWVIWHLIEHDLHHGGEIAFSLGMHGLPANGL
jgi:uncharacterized damage-inducible protein DinB